MMKNIEILDAQQVVVNTIYADEDFAQQYYPDSWRLAPAQPEPAPVVVSRVLTKLAFRRKFTDLERPYIDEFNATFETNPALTAEQKRSIRSGLEDYKMATEINLDDPSTAQMLGLYEAVGLIAAGRAAEILS